MDKNMKMKCKLGFYSSFNKWGKTTPGLKRATAETLACQHMS